MKLIKVTEVKGSVNFYPHNRQNLQFYTNKKESLSKEKKEKYQVEEVELTEDEAKELGFFEGVQTIQKKVTTTDLMQQMMEQNAQMAKQNAQLIALLSEKNGVSETPKTKK